MKIVQQLCNLLLNLIILIFKLSTLHRYALDGATRLLPSPTRLTSPAPHLSPALPLTSPHLPSPHLDSPQSPDLPQLTPPHLHSQPHPASLPSPKHPQQWPLLQHRPCPSSSQAPAAASPAASAARPLKQPAPRSPALEAACPPQPGPRSSSPAPAAAG